MDVRARNPLHHAGLQPHGLRQGRGVRALRHDFPDGGVQGVHQRIRAGRGFPRPAPGIGVLVLQFAGHAAEDLAAQHGYASFPAASDAPFFRRRDLSSTGGAEGGTGD